MTLIAGIPATIIVPFDGNSSTFQFTITDPCTGRPFIIVSYYYWYSSDGKRLKDGKLIRKRHWGPLTYIKCIPDWHTFRPWKGSRQV